MRGKASSRPPLPPLWRDHPRVCGEKMAGYWGQKESYGSPPRMRGKVPRYVEDWLDIRITPAYAGKRILKRPTPTKTEDHPRVCGEKLIMPAGTAWLKGSPPRMRGKVQPVQPPGRLLGITPAYAGKRRATALRCRCTRDHPRICGEKCNQRVRMVEQPGSPPHMRGKDMGLRASRIAGGITPAYAGKRNRFRFASFYKRDHPRICGEKA